MKKFLFLFVCFLLSCQPSVIEIVVISDSPAYCDEYKRGAELAVDIINAEGGANGHKLRLSFCEPRIIEETKRELSAVFLSPCNYATVEKAIRFSETEKVPLFYLFPYFKKGEYSFLLGGEILSEVSFLADSAVYSLHSDTALILDFDETISNHFKECFEKNGGKTEVLKCKELSADDCKNKLINSFSKKEIPQIVFFAGLEKENIEPFYNLIENSILIAPYSFCVLNGLESFDGVFTSLPWFDFSKKTLKVEEFVQRYEDISGEKPDYQSSLIYESIFLFKDILNQSLPEENSPEIFRNSPAMLELSGKLFFDRDRVLKRRLALSVTKNKGMIDLNLLSRSVLKSFQEKVIEKRLKK